MTKIEAIRLFGSRPTDLARAVGVSRQAVNDWPEVLTAKQADRVQAALWRLSQGVVPKASKEAA